MRREDSQAVKRLRISKAHIVCLGRGRTYAAYHKGDRRKRPLFYMETVQVERLLRAGYLVAVQGNQFAVRDGDSAKQGPQLRTCRRKPVLDRLSQSRAGRATFLSVAEVRAGRRFSSDFARMHFGAFTGQRFNQAARIAISASGPEAAMASRIDAQRSIDNALKAVGREKAHILKSVLGHGLDLGPYETQMGWTAGQAKITLKRALAALKTHYVSCRR